MDSKDSTISFTFDDDGVVQALVKIDDDSTMYLRDNKDWGKVGKDDDAPELFDRTIVDVSPDHIDEAVRNFDTAEQHNEQLERADVAYLL